MIKLKLFLITGCSALICGRDVDNSKQLLDSSPVDTKLLVLHSVAR